MRMLTHEEFCSRLQESYGDEYRPITEYNGKKTPIQFEHTKCGTIFPATPEAILKKRSCPLCDNKKGQQHKKEFFKKKLKEKYPSLKLINKYVDNDTKVKLQCEVCKNTWYDIPRSLVYCKNSRKFDCPFCKVQAEEKNVLSKNIKARTIGFKNFLKVKFSNKILLVSNYTNIKSSVKFHCNVCNNEWNDKASTVHTKDIHEICPICYKSYKKIYKKFKKEYKRMCKKLEKNYVTEREWDANKPFMCRTVLRRELNETYGETVRKCGFKTLRTILQNQELKQVENKILELRLQEKSYTKIAIELDKKISFMTVKRKLDEICKNSDQQIKEQLDKINKKLLYNKI